MKKLVLLLTLLTSCGGNKPDDGDDGQPGLPGEDAISKATFCYLDWVNSEEISTGTKFYYNVFELNDGNFMASLSISYYAGDYKSSRSQSVVWPSEKQEEESVKVVDVAYEAFIKSDKKAYVRRLHDAAVREVPCGE